ncbi:hypothetical protein C9I57_18500 [Trinickia symbiotica]|uniref:Mandelate racemase/muconate lactonizing enzyme C-terminal domain-containing protein n=1 Tax=Trinickia symbiotica TaxID=863227 RepID=A0A2T3XRB8_9BURK|nr:mandelate racemase/muconate lactonizing enzyme family protein [Trinickia symbiotica]PTB19054.1 hypothetical protein C9I57_18500 [Trinickia symbiotica]
MKISKIALYSYKFQYRAGDYTFRPKPVEDRVNDSTVVVLETDAGLFGVGETCPLRPTYLPSTPESARAGLSILAKALVGVDAVGPRAIYRAMDDTLNGFPEAKSAIDVAAWDLLGKAANLPCYALFGGKQNDGVPVFETIGPEEPEEMVANLEAMRRRGTKVFQLSMGRGFEEDVHRLRSLIKCIAPGERVTIDANRRCTGEQAIRVVNGILDLTHGKDIWIEQPCKTYAESRYVRSRIGLPMLLDEVINDSEDLLSAVYERSLDGVVTKLSHVGGPSRVLDLIAIAASGGVKVRIEDTSGSAIARAASAHLASVIPRDGIFATYAFPESDFKLGVEGGILSDGILRPTGRAGLGVELDMTALGEPLAVYSA